MAHYQIFIPEVSGADPKHLNNVGLASLQADKGAEWFPVQRGPDGKTGMIACWNCGDPNIDAKVGFHPEIQTWTPVEENGDLAASRYYLGIENDRRPRSDDLKKKDLYAGNYIELGDGDLWMVPTAQKLPHNLSIGPNGSVKRSVKSDYQSYYDRAMKVSSEFFQAFGLYDLIMSGEEDPDKADDEIVEFNVVDGLFLVADGLALNYRINIEVASMLGLFDEQSLVRALTTVCDLAEIADTRDKKKEEPLRTVTINASSLT